MVEPGFGFIMTAYNLRRITNIVGLKNLEEYLRMMVPFILKNMAQLKVKLSDISTFIYQRKNKK
tara:strand:+ start:15519 stop:15710 length:192 start_codon:yes stop_codon:yes gene_type:complete